MASVTSLDADVRNLRLSRYTPQAAADARTWIENTLHSTLPSGDLLEALKDGVTLCQLANLAIQPQLGAIKFKSSSMPFIQMENISHFLRACELPPLNLPAHDRFLTVDLYEQKDPAQVLQCLGAFSRQANHINPAKFPHVIGPKAAMTAQSPTHTGNLNHGAGWRRPPSPTKCYINPTVTGGSVTSHRTNEEGAKSSPAPTSSWSKSSDERSTAPAWNIHQYGYMGGASQGNQGVSFGARRQITTQSPSVPSLAEKQKLRMEKDAEAERVRREEMEALDRQRRAAEEEEQNAKAAEERKWEEETRKLREQERRRIEEQKTEWERQERKWKEEEEARRHEEAALEANIQKLPPAKPRLPSANVLRGQTLSEWQREQASATKGSTGDSNSNSNSNETPEQNRVRELERQLEEARERERQYQAEREERLRREEGATSSPAPTTTKAPAEPRSSRESEVSWASDEREHLRQTFQSSRESTPAKPLPIGKPRPLPTEPRLASSPFSRPPVAQSPHPTAPDSESPAPALAPAPSLPNRAQPAAAAPEPDDAFHPQERTPNRTEQFLTTHAAPSPNPGPRIAASREAGDTSLEQAQLRDQRVAGQQRTQAGAWASKSLLEREMERERARQREWEADQHATRAAPRDPAHGVGEGQTWDVNQYGYLGGDNMNRGSSVGSGINIGGRRQIVGPRPKP